MTDPQPLPIAEPITACKSCFEKVSPADRFCQKCGFPLKGSDSEQQIFLYRKDFKKADASNNLTMFEKKIKSARTTLYVLAGIFMLYGLVSFFFNRTGNGASAILISYTAVTIIFLLLATWSSKKPVASIVSGMTLYILLQILAAIENPVNLFSGIIFKVVIVSYLVNGLLSALEAEKLRKEHHL